MVTGVILGWDGRRGGTGLDEQPKNVERSTTLDGLMQENIAPQLGIFGQKGLASQPGEEGHLPLGREGRRRRRRRGWFTGLQHCPPEADHDGRLAVLAGDLGTLGAGVDQRF